MTHWPSRFRAGALSVTAVFDALAICGAVLTAPVTVPAAAPPAPREVTFSQSAQAVDAYDFVEVSAPVVSPDAKNPFTDATLTGWFETADGSRRWQVEGFCDAEDASVYSIRFMPPEPDDYRYSVVYRRAASRRPSREISTPTTAAGAGPSALIPSTLGTSSGRAQGNITSSTAPRLTG